MPNPPQGMHSCPTRADGESALFAHMITLTTCQQRQREHYHKCPTCVRNNVRVPSAREVAQALAKLSTPGKLNAG